MTATFENGGKKIFSAWLEMTKIPKSRGKLALEALKFFSYGHESICYEIDQVACTFDGQDQDSSTHKMTKSVPYDQNKLQVFKKHKLETPLICPFVITFNVKLRTRVANFINTPVDITWSHQLWTSAVNRKMTDVEFLVGEETFGAHRSLLCARNPVFAAMFASGMKEAENGQVRIEDVDPPTFERFLKFLYTGMMESSAMDEKLFAVGDKYQVETLMELCRPATLTPDTDDGIWKALLSL